MRRGLLILDRPEQGVVESRVYNDAGGKIVSHRNIVDVQSESFESKERWFHHTCHKLPVAQASQLSLRSDATSF